MTRCEQQIMACRLVSKLCNIAVHQWLNGRTITVTAYASVWRCHFGIYAAMTKINIISKWKNSAKYYVHFLWANGALRCQANHRSFTVHAQHCKPPAKGNTCFRLIVCWRKFNLFLHIIYGLIKLIPSIRSCGNQLGNRFVMFKYCLHIVSFVKLYI